MEFPFAHLISTRIVRMLHPQEAMSTATDSSTVPQIAETALAGSDTSVSTAETEEIQCMNEVAEKKWGVDNMLVFPNKFGYDLDSGTGIAVLTLARPSAASSTSTTCRRCTR